MYKRLAERLATDFQQNPLNYVAEADLQVALVELLRSELSPSVASADEISLKGASADSFKSKYWQTAEQKLSERGQLDRVHAEVSIQQGERLDVAVFRPELSSPIQWVSGGSKRFDETDIDCVYELKFVKNKTSFPKHLGYPISELTETNLSVETMLKRANSEKPLLDFSENKIRADIHELNRLQNVRGRYLLLFSNNNYLYHKPTSAESESYRYGELYHKMGKAARKWMRRESDDGVGILYVHPCGMTWLTNS